jgi:IclR family acetate operon transcriptional repressor
MAASVTKKTSGTQRYHVPNLERALTIMEHLAQCGQPASLTDLSEALKLPKNSVFRILKTLQSHGYLDVDADGRSYRLSRKLLSLGYAAMGEGHLADLARDVLRELRDRTGETTLLGVLVGTHGVVIEQVPSRQPVKFLVDVGTAFPIHTSAPGKAIVAFLPTAEQRTLLHQISYTRYNPRTLSSRTAFAKELATVQKTGYATDRGEHIDGLHCVGAPIFDHRSTPLAAIWITAPAYRLPKTQLQPIAQAVIDSARTLSLRLGHRHAAS